jgi:hypothetical protein
MMTYSWLRKEGCDNLQLSRDLVTFVILHATMTWNIARGKLIGSSTLVIHLPGLCGE